MQNKKYRKKMLFAISLVFIVVITVALIIFYSKNEKNTETSKPDDTSSSQTGGIQENEINEELSVENSDETTTENKEEPSLNSQYKDSIDAIRLINPHVMKDGQLNIDIMTVDEPAVGWQIIAYKMRTDHDSFPMIAVIDNRGEIPKVVVPLHHYATGGRYVDDNNLPSEVNKQLISNKGSYARWRSFYSE